MVQSSFGCASLPVFRSCTCIFSKSLHCSCPIIFLSSFLTFVVVFFILIHCRLLPFCLRMGLQAYWNLLLGFYPVVSSKLLMELVTELWFIHISNCVWIAWIKRNTFLWYDYSTKRNLLLIQGGFVGVDENLFSLQMVNNSSTVCGTLFIFCE